MSAQQKLPELAHMIGEMSGHFYNNWAIQLGPNATAQQFKDAAKKAMLATAIYVDVAREEYVTMATNLTKYGNAQGTVSVEQGL